MNIEAEVVHPAVAAWLDKQEGVQYEHEKVTTAGRIDFVAAKRVAQTEEVELWIIECKVWRKQLRRACMQVLYYGRAEEVKGTPVRHIVALPVHEANSLTRSQLEGLRKRRIELLPVACVMPDCL